MRVKGIRIVLLVAAAFLLFGLLSGLRASTSILASSISEWTGLSYGTVSIAFSVMNIVLAFSGPLFGLLTLKIHPAKIMMAGAVMGAIGFFGTAFSSTLPALIVFLGVFFGLGASALCYSIVYAAAVPVIGVKYSIIFGGILSASQGAVSMVLAPVFSFGSEVFGVQACLIGIGVVSLVLIPLSFLFLRKKDIPVSEDKREPLFTSLKSSVTLPFFLMMALGMFTYGICDGGMINHLYEFTQMYGAAETMSAVMVSIYSCCCMVGAILGGVICSHVRNRKGVFGVIFIVTALLTALGYLLPVGYVTGFVEYGLFGLGMGMCVPTLSAITQDRVPIEKFAAVFSMLYFFMIIAYAIDSLLGGILYDIFGNFLLVDGIAFGLAVAVAVIFTISGLMDKKKQKDGRI